MSKTNDEHTRWDGAKITSGGFHAIDCPCEGCKALAKTQRTPREREILYSDRAKLSLALKAAEQQRDELLTALRDIADFGRSYGLTAENAVDGIRSKCAAIVNAFHAEIQAQ